MFTETRLIVVTAHLSDDTLHFGYKVQLANAWANKLCLLQEREGKQTHCGREMK